MRRIREAGIVALGVACLGCGPRLNAEWLPEARDLSRWPYGAAVEIRLDERGAEPVRGELIAVGAETLFVLTPAGLRGVRRDHLGSVATRADREGKLQGPRIIGRGPWLRSARARRWDELRAYARFPGGLPDSLDRASLRMPGW